MKILVIDDDSGLRRTASLILEDEGYSVVTAADGKDGLEKAQKESPDLILSDVRMPGLDGMAFVEQYRSSEGDASVIMMTAYGNAELAVEAVRADPHQLEQVLVNLLLNSADSIEENGIRGKVEIETRTSVVQLARARDRPRPGCIRSSRERYGWGDPPCGPK